MTCACGGKLEVRDTYDNETTVTRFRVCPTCDRGFHTVEAVVDLNRGRYARPNTVLRQTGGSDAPKKS